MATPEELTFEELALKELTLKELTPQALWEGLRHDWFLELKAAGNCEHETSPEAWRQTVEHRRDLLTHMANGKKNSAPLLLIADPVPTSFLASFLAALLAGWHVAIANPRWGVQEWQSVSALIAPDLVWGIDLPRSLVSNKASEPAAHIALTSPESPAILIPTGGSSGQIKFVCHHWSSLTASVNGFRQYFSPGGEAINTFCVLPLHHVSGLMQILRTWYSHGQTLIAPPNALKSLDLLSADDALTSFFSSSTALSFISLVPTQLSEILQTSQSAWLRQFRSVLLGGAPPWQTLLNQAAEAQVPLCLSYGMTETAAMVTVSSGKPLPHVAIQIVENGQPLPPGQVGQIVVRSPAVAWGYCGAPTFTPNTFYTDDLGYLSPDGTLHITGRASTKIISGGENIFPAEVEAAIWRTGQVKDVCVLGLPHPHWGEAVTAVYVPADLRVCAESLRQAIAQPSSNTSSNTSSNSADAKVPMLSRYKHPKRWVSTTALPRNAQGKLNRHQLLVHLLASDSVPESGADERAPLDLCKHGESMPLPTPFQVSRQLSQRK